MNSLNDLIDKLAVAHRLNPDEYRQLLEHDHDETFRRALTERARCLTRERFGNRIFTRGLIEISNHCKNDCYYCGIRASNHAVTRYRLTDDQIMECCATGYALGFRTFVMQGGEDRGISDERITTIVAQIRREYPDCAITLSLGERPRKVYQAWFDAGANRYLLRHETINADHYRLLHPAGMSLENRVRCLHDLRDIGFQTGTGIMVGSPFQTIDHVVEDICFIEQFAPQMIGLGPFLPQHDTPFAEAPKGSLERTLVLLAIFRLMFPDALIPATTSLGTLIAGGRLDGILAGANVVMPNLSPLSQRKKYALYDGKIATDEEAAEGRAKLQKQFESIGYTLCDDRGDYKNTVSCTMQNQL